MTQEEFLNINPAEISAEEFYKHLVKFGEERYIWYKKQLEIVFKEKDVFIPGDEFTEWYKEDLRDSKNREEHSLKKHREALTDIRQGGDGMFFKHVKKPVLDESVLFKKTHYIVKELIDCFLNTELTLINFSEIYNAIYKVFELKNLKKGWDDEYSLPIEIKHIEDGIDTILHLFEKYKKIPTFIAPTVCSGVLLEYAGDEDRLDIRIGDEKNILTIYFKNKKFIEKKSFSNVNDISLF